MTLLLQLLVNAVVNAALYSLLAIGFGLVYRSIRFFYIAFGGVYLAVSYAVLAGTTLMGLPLWISISGGITIGILIGELMNRAIYLPLDGRGAKSGVLFIASLGSYIIIVNLIALKFGNDIKTILAGLEPSFPLGFLIVTRMQLAQLLIGWSIVLVFWIITSKSSFMKGLWAMGETPMLVAVLGLPVNSMRTMVFGISSLMAGSASILTALDIGVDPYIGMKALLTGAVAILVGGVDRLWGWIAGAVLIAFLQSIAAWQFSAKWTDLITFGILILTLLFRPQGLFSPAKRREER